MESVKNIINSSQIKRNIMRRVWYSYVLSILLRGSTVRGVILGASVVLFFELVSVHNILLNLLAVQLGQVPVYVWQVLTETATNGGLLKLITLGAIIFSLLSFRINFTHRNGEREMQTV